MGSPHPAGKLERFFVRLPPELITRMEKVAVWQKVNRCEVVRRAIEEYCDRMELLQVEHAQQVKSVEFPDETSV